ncbi:two-component hybrid sensor and regulator [Nostoc carneum NIES-2107]|nr:two-component hybrid sensor and regulator [Nostoc carneum NIES-2107]
MSTALYNRKSNKNIKVLVVEDDHILAVNFQEILESLEYTVVGIANSAETAITKATDLNPNLILMDVQLQYEIDGIEAAGEIWDNLQIPIIYVTEYSDTNTVDRAIQTFPFAYLLKPVGRQDFYVSIQIALNLYKREKIFSTVLHAIKHGVIVVDSQLRIEYMNHVAQTLTGWEFKEAKEQVFTTVLKLIDQQNLLNIKNPIISAFQKETTIYYHKGILLIAINGNIIPVATSASAFKDDQGEITGGVIVFWENR